MALPIVSFLPAQMHTDIPVSGQSIIWHNIVAHLQMSNLMAAVRHGCHFGGNVQLVNCQCQRAGQHMFNRRFEKGCALHARLHNHMRAGKSLTSSHVHSPHRKMGYACQQVTGLQWRPIQAASFANPESCEIRIYLMPAQNQTSLPFFCFWQEPVITLLQFIMLSKLDLQCSPDVLLGR